MREYMGNASESSSNTQPETVRIAHAPLPLPSMSADNPRQIREEVILPFSLAKIENFIFNVLKEPEKLKYPLQLQ
jgi:hypothetical protein